MRQDTEDFFNMGTVVVALKHIGTMVLLREMWKMSVRISGQHIL